MDDDDNGLWTMVVVMSGLELVAMVEVLVVAALDAAEGLAAGRGGWERGAAIQITNGASGVKELDSVLQLN